VNERLSHDRARRWRICLLAVTFVAPPLVHPADGQQIPPRDNDPVAEAPLRFGPVGIEPRFRIENFGIDGNVFNTREDEQRDFTVTAAPGAEMFLRTGRGLLSLDGQVEFVYFKEFETERSINSDARGQYELRFNRLRPYASASTLNTRQRPGYEIDARARHYETEFHAGADLRLASKSTIRVDGRHLVYTFAGDAVFDGLPLNQELNRTQRGLDVSWRKSLTTLTTWVTRGARETERFAFEPSRNSNSVRVTSGFELGRLALIRGSAFMGYRKLSPASGGILPEFSGLTADVDVAYTAPTQTRLSAFVQRDVQYSYQRATPYYVQTGWTATLTQRTISKWELQLSGGRDRLAYRALNPVDGRTDFISRFGGGVGYVVGDSVRVSFDVHSFYRSSVLEDREYGGLRAGVSVIYGD
jgi:hypothetical protein